MNRALVLASLLVANVASADSHHILVLRAEGNADAATRGKIDVQVLKLAKNVDSGAEAGDVSFADAAMATGCSPSEPACKDEVLGMLGVDEMVVTNVTSFPNGELKVNVRRLAKTGAPQTASASIPSGTPADQKLNAEVGPMFGLTPPPAPAVEKKPATPPTPAVEKKPATPAMATTQTPPLTEQHAAPPPAAATPAPTVTAAPEGQITPQPEETPGTWENRRLEITGIVIGGGLVALGALFWGEASSTQNDIDAAMPKSPADFQHLQDLENQGDSYATLGNICVIGGIGVAAASAYFYFHDRREARAAHTARITPILVDHGAGVALTFGGGR